MADGPGALGKSLIVLGLVIVAMGALIILLGKFPGLRIGRLPGDIYIEREGWRFYFPITTSIMLSVILSLLVWFFRRR
ncbi:MAG TPA: DUF2905 domain-containing protein [Blastocatellia bacterium]|jgi:hypothetical protein|nr:DUF2905 domain-containing protein [Blastocatellia bacterium]